MHIKDALLGATCFVPPGVIVMAAKSIEDLEAELGDILASSQEIIDAADAESEGDLSDEQLAEIDANKVKADKIKRQIEARKAVAASTTPPVQAGRGRQSAAEPVENRSGQGDGASRRVPAAPRVDNGRYGLQSFGAFAQGVRNIALGIENEDTRKIRNSTATYGNEQSGADGSYLIPPTFNGELWKKVQAEDPLMARCASLVTDGNSMMIPKDETTPWQTTGGVQVYWEGEGQVPTNSKPLFELGALRLSKLMALVPVSEELLQDASGIASWLNAKAPAKMAAKINTAIIGGTGAGQPLGIIPSYSAVGASVVQVSKETSQPADTVWMTNIEKMYGRMYAPWRRNAVWLINQDLEPSLAGMAFQATGASSALPGTSAVPAYLPPGGLSNSPYATLKGRPVIPVEACSAIGDLGDIIFVDLNQYWVLTKSGGLQTDTSIHLYFDQALTAFRFIFRMNGQPAWSSTITRQNGSSNELSWAVALQAR